MRLLRALFCDIQYQFKYGFYFLYVAMSAIYIGILSIIPADWRQLGSALILLTDPATLGFMFIGGILLLEKGEGLHSYLSILPLRVSEYIWAKVFSLALVSTLAGCAIAAIGLPGPVNLSLLAASLFFGSGVFTLTGLAVGACARTVNHYLVISLPVETLLMTPPLLVIFGITRPWLEIFPGTLLLRALSAAVGVAVPYAPIVAVIGLFPWLALAFWPAKILFQRSLQSGGGGGR